MYERTLPGLEKQPQLPDFFYEHDIQLQIQVPPTPHPPGLIHLLSYKKQSEIVAPLFILDK